MAAFAKQTAHAPVNLDHLPDEFAERVRRHLAAMGDAYHHAAVALAVVEAFTELRERTVRAVLARDDDALGQALAEGEALPQIADSFITMAEPAGTA